MQGDGNRFLIYFEDEEHIVRRLGAAVVACWEELDPRLQAMLIERAGHVVDEEAVEDLGAELKRFVPEDQGPCALA